MCLYIINNADVRWLFKINVQYLQWNKRQCTVFLLMPAINSDRNVGFGNLNFFTHYNGYSNWLQSHLMLSNDAVEDVIELTSMGLVIPNRCYTVSCWIAKSLISDRVVNSRGRSRPDQTWGPYSVSQWSSMS